MAATPAAPPSEQTHPRVGPSRGHRHTAFTLGFTLRETPGHEGVSATTYRVVLSPPRRTCAAPASPPVTSGTAGTRKHVRLAAPRRGWCTGRFAVTVYLDTGPYCERGQPCPLFASQVLATGTAHFRVDP